MAPSFSSVTTHGGIATDAAIARLRGDSRVAKSARYVADRAKARMLARKESSTWDDVLRELRLLDPTLIGVDVFDTVLTRRLAPEAAVEVAVGLVLSEKGLWDGSVADYVAARKTAFQQHPGGTLLDWLSSGDLAAGLVCSADVAFELEVEVERDLIVPVPGARDALEEMRSIAEVRFVSDMHLPGEVLRELLDDHDLLTDDTSVVVSCEMGESKADGGLFARAFAPNELTRKTVFIGNNIWADVVQAEASGLSAVPATGGNLRPLEQLLADAGGAGSAISAATRIARLEPMRSPLAVEGTQALGLMMSAFLLWARDISRDEGIQQLHFLARDGLLPFEMARAMPQDHWSGIDLRYLHCNRRAWSLAGADVVGVREWIDLGMQDADGYLLHSSNGVPFSSMLKRVGLQQDDLPRSSELASLNVNIPLSGDMAAQWEDLLRNGSLDSLIASRAAEANDLLTRFLQQEQFSDGRIGLVDVGWRGHQAWLVSSLIESATGATPINLHFGGDQVLADLPGAVDIRRFALDDSVRAHPIASPVSCLEMLMAPGGPRILGYADNGGVVEQVFEQEVIQPDAAKRSEFVSGAVAVAALMPTAAWFEERSLTSIELAEATRNVLAAFWNQTDRRTAELYQHLEFEADDGGAVFGDVVAEYSLGELVNRHPIPRQWRAGSLALTPEPLRSLVKAYFGVRK